MISNSLGAMPGEVAESLAEYATAWATRGVRAWEERWWTLGREVAGHVGAIIGAPAGSVAMADNVSTAHAIVLSTLPPPGALPFPELLEGGDLLINSAMTRLPFALHRDNYLNHAEALWDDALKAQIIAILNSAPLALKTADISFLTPLLLSGPG